MGSLNPFKKPKKPDTSALEAQEKRLKEQEATLAADEAERKKKEEATRRSRAGRSGARSLLSGLETGVASEDNGKRGSLG